MCFQVNNRVSKLIIFPSYVSKLIITDKLLLILGSRISGNIVLCPTCPLKGITASMYEVKDDHSRGQLIEEIKLTENSGRFFNFKKIESGKNSSIK